MEDSLENYIKIARNVKEVSKNESKLKVSEYALLKKKECESRAVKIVEFLIEGQLRPEVFLRCLKHINQTYYQDVVEERAITKLCGYSLCGKTIPDMPKQQFYIDTKSNKVYDVTDRKNYCSNFCYKASTHIKNQIDNSPLWLRKLEDSPSFNLLPKTERGIPGEEINQGIAKPAVESQFTSVAEFADASLAEMEVGSSKRNIKKQVADAITMETVKEDDETEQACEELQTESQSQLDKPEKINEEVTRLQPQLAKRKKSNPNPNEGRKPKEVFDTIKKYVHEWITLETYIYLYGEDYLKTAMNDNTRLQEYLGKNKQKETVEVQRRKYLEICRKLRLTQLADEKFDRAVTSNYKLKPVPDFKRLKEESKSMDLKVRSFYSGITYELNEPTKKTDVIKVQATEKDYEEDVPAILPLVDSNSQALLRKRVYLNSVSKAVGNIAQSLGIPSSYVLQDVPLLVKTFKLEPHNVVLKPAVLNLVAVILLKMLSIRNTNLKTLLETQKSQTFMKIMLSRLPNAEIFVSKFYEEIQNVNLFLEKYFFDGN